MSTTPGPNSEGQRTPNHSDSRTVTDPVTHAALSVHDNTSDELLAVSTKSTPTSEDPPNLDNLRRSHMNGVVDAESRTDDSDHGGWIGLIFSISMCCVLGLVAPAVVLYFWNPPSPRVQLHGEETQLHKPESDSPESAAWFNSLLYSLWPIVNPALFTSVSDMLEDALQASLPSLIHGVRVADIGQGSEAVRILAIRALESDDATRSSDDEGDFLNLEVALAFRARPRGTGLKDRSGNPHILMEFQVAGGILLPVSLKCTPLAKSFLNVMDIPGLSGWLQSSIDSAVSAYVAPRSLNMDLKTMLSGRDQMDTETIGIVFVIVKSAVGCTDGDGGKFWESKAEKRGDPYATIGWGKWGKAIWSSERRSPVWEEIAVLLVGPSEMNAKEKLRVQVWDSDRGAADDLLGTVEVNLHDLINDPKTQNNSTPWPGELRWEVGYFAKTTLEQHLKEKGENVDEFKRNIEHDAERELREAETLQHDAQAEIEKQKQADLKDRSDEIIAGSPPTDAWPRGYSPSRSNKFRGWDETEDEGDQDLPSAYCTVIINHARVYKTRTKLKSNKPFFAASTERFIKDWRTTTVMIAVRDSRQHEVDPLIGVVVLPLRTVLKDRSQINDAFPLVGGVSLVFRSVQARLPKSLLGWDIGTLDIQPRARASDDAFPTDLAACRLVLRTVNAKGKMRAQPENRVWEQKRGKPVRLAVKRRFGECFLVEFRKNSLGPDHTPAFCTLWLKDIAQGALARARVNAEQPEGVEKVGTLEMTVKMWPGLSGYHKPLAAHDPNFADVIQVLDAAEEMGSDKDSTHDSLYDAEASSDSEDEGAAGKPESEGDNGEGKGGIVTEIKEYNKRKGELHRKHRGMMQWSGVRKLVWIGHNVEEAAVGVEQKVKGKFNHHQAEQGMDVEA
ncbi:hypothetical protein B0H12DRAFT_1117399 [Mycena haematopus]|nr:hypothetical protein B0H12DRAFT_1117399 [Mycena haematopus]